jgi:hypothetical protein
MTDKQALTLLAIMRTMRRTARPELRMVKRIVVKRDGLELH